MHLGLPVRVQGHNSDGTSWEEMATTEDAYTNGVSFVLLKHQVAFGQALFLSLPLPKSFRRYDLSTASYSVYALVRNTTPLLGGLRVGLMLLGRTPPKGHADNPGGRFLLPTDAMKVKHTDRRRARRFEVRVLLKVRRTQNGGEEEQTITRNLGLGGALVLTTLPVSKNETVLVEALDGAFKTRAEVQNIVIGQDNIPCLNLHFLDEEVTAGISRVLRESGFSE